MRKVALGLLLLGLLAVSASPAVAGSADPLGLITSGAVIPYFGSTGAGTALTPGSVSYLEVATPVGGAPGLHMFFHDATCKRGPISVGLPMTENDSEIVLIEGLEAKNPVDGLITMANVDASGFNLVPMGSTENLHARVLWFNLLDGFGRTLEPISVSNPENNATATNPLDMNRGALYNPLKDGATFVTPAPHFGVETKLYLVCPNEIIAGPRSDAGCTCTPEQITNGTCECTADLLATTTNTPSFCTPSGGACPGATFPAIELARNDQKTNLFVRVYDHDERFRRDIRSDCSCLTRRTMAELGSVYANPVEIPLWAYTEVEARSRVRLNDGSAVTGSSTREGWFTGYRVMHVGGLDLFGRLSNAAAATLRNP